MCKGSLPQDGGQCENIIICLMFLFFHMSLPKSGASLTSLQFTAYKKQVNNQLKELQSNSQMRQCLQGNEIADRF